MSASSRFKLSIDMDNAAFTDGDPGTEVAYILKKLSSRIVGRSLVDLTEQLDEKLRDSNGNKVGEWTVTQ